MKISLVCRLPQSILSEAESKNIKSWVQQFKLQGGLTPPRHANDYTLSYSRSSGPGGQNVNKVSTKATVRLDLEKAKTWLPEHVQQGLIQSVSQGKEYLRIIKILKIAFPSPSMLTLHIPYFCRLCVIELNQPIRTTVCRSG